MSSTDLVDALVIGGGFYGTVVAAYLAGTRGLRRVALVEREHDLLLRASYANQARVHNGYHYPRSLTTAFRSRVNLPRFARDYPEAVRRDFTKIYAIARSGSRVTARQFERFCRDIGAPLSPLPHDLRPLFNSRLVEAAFLVEEFAFDATALRGRAWADLRRNGVGATLGARITGLRRAGDRILATGSGEGGRDFEMLARHVFNCTYSGLNQFTGDFHVTHTRLKHEITELALVRPPQALAGLGITVMDGPFFSIMPFPARNLHSLSHVRYTPHRPWSDQCGTDPYRRLDEYDKSTRVERMMRDACRFIPAIGEATYRGSLFEVKTVLERNEGDDGRPILFETHAELGSCHSILGGKIDNIYDVLEKLDNVPLH